VALAAVSWADYEAIGAALRDRPTLRLTYDRGALEIMTTSSRHELLDNVGRFVQVLAEEYGFELWSAGSMTFQQPEERALEPDQCYWLANAPQVAGRPDYDSAVDPPPDLVVEVELSRSAVDRLPLFARLGVPEVWRVREGEVLVEVLEGGLYTARAESPTFPGLSPAEIARRLTPIAGRGALQMAREFREWVRTQRAAGEQP